jgi:hypothetical protein
MKPAKTSWSMQGLPAQSKIYKVLTLHNWICNLLAADPRARWHHLVQYKLLRALQIFFAACCLQCFRHKCLYNRKSPRNHGTTEAMHGECTLSKTVSHHLSSIEKPPALLPLHRSSLISSKAAQLGKIDQNSTKHHKAIESYWIQMHR